MGDRTLGVFIARLVGGDDGAPLRNLMTKTLEVVSKAASPDPWLESTHFVFVRNEVVMSVLFALSLLVATMTTETVAQSINYPCVSTGGYMRYPWDYDLTRMFPMCSNTEGHICDDNLDGTYTCRVHGAPWTSAGCAYSSGSTCLFPSATDPAQCYSHMTLQASTYCSQFNTYSTFNSNYANAAQACIVGGASGNCWWTGIGCLQVTNQCGTTYDRCEFARTYGNCQAAQCSYSGEGLLQNTCEDEPTSLNSNRVWMYNYQTEGLLYGTYAGQWTTNSADSQLACGESTNLGSSGTILTGISVRCCDVASLSTYTCFSEAYYSGGQWYLAAQLNGNNDQIACDLSLMPTVVCASAASVTISKLSLLLAVAVAAIRGVF